MKHEYMKILADEPQWAIRAQRVADRLYEFTDFIVNVLGVTDVGATLNKKVTFTNPATLPVCSALRNHR